MTRVREIAGAELAALRAAFGGAALPAVIVPDAVGEADRAALRRAMDARELSRQSLADRGSYAYPQGWGEPALFAALARAAGSVAGMSLAVEGWRWARLERGDYALSRDDGAGRDCVAEATLDFSARESGAAELCYARHGRLVCALPQRPGSVAVVGRGEGIGRYERYLNHRVGDAAVYRLTVWLRSAG